MRVNSGAQPQPVQWVGAWQETVAAIKAAWTALSAEPVGILLALLTVALVINALLPRARFRDRMFSVTLAIVSGITAWMIATRWRWPK
jgi:uncharacterized membrane protein